jgi:hypothetical protein
MRLVEAGPAGLFGPFGSLAVEVGLPRRSGGFKVADRDLAGTSRVTTTESLQQFAVFTTGPLDQLSRLRVRA